jgi:hypothetical protein
MIIWRWYWSIIITITISIRCSIESSNTITELTIKYFISFYASFSRSLTIKLRYFIDEFSWSEYNIRRLRNNTKTIGKNKSNSTCTSISCPISVELSRTISWRNNWWTSSRSRSRSRCRNKYVINRRLSISVGNCYSRNKGLILRRNCISLTGWCCCRSSNSWSIIYNLSDDWHRINRIHRRNIVIITCRRYLNLSRWSSCSSPGYCNNINRWIVWS